METALTTLEGVAGPQPPEARAFFLSVDPHALLARWSLPQTVPNPEEVLGAITLPCLVYAGEADPQYASAQATAGLIPGATFLGLPGLDHAQVYRQPSPILPHVRESLGRVG